MTPVPARPRRVLVCGASGFIGARVSAHLQARGHTVRALSRRSTPPLDFARATRPQDWQPLLQDIDAVVNAVGVLRDSRRQPMAALHEAAPRALFEACAHAGVRRVVHVSALGIDGNPTRYAATKRAADARLLALTEAGSLDGAVLRPSVVFGRGGASSELFLQLARLPWLLLPAPVLRAHVQPLAVDELAEAVAHLVQADTPAGRATGLMALAGPRTLTLAAFIAALRTQAGHPPARVAALPGWANWASARLGDAVPVSPWCSETLALLATDNVADPAVLQALLGRPATAPEALWATLRHDIAGAASR